jgi:hypothetical protein
MLQRLHRAALAAFASAAVFAAAAPAAADPTVWVARSHGSTVYLMGTVHLLPPDVKWRTPAVERALKDSSEVWLEMVLPVGPGSAEEMKRTQQLIATTGMAPAGQTLSSKLTPDQWTRLQAVVAPGHVPPAALDRMRPWLASVVAAQTIAQSAGWSSDNGADVVLDREALAQGKTLKGFETAEGQIQLFGAMPEDAQLGLLLTSLDDAGEAGKAKLAVIARNWAAGDDAAAEQYLVKELRDKSPELYARMVAARNRAWVPQIEDMLKTPGVRMIAVGEGHLLGPDGVPALLKADGVRIERVH